MIEDLNLLYKAFKDSKKNSNWKPEVQKFEMNWLTELALLQKDLSDKTYKTSNNTEFIINERGKTRKITSNKMRDRVVRHVFCDNVLYPNIEKYLIYDNGASRKGKGISFTRNRLLKHLRNYYHHFGNDGYILLMDFSKYYDNIRHDIIKNQFKDKIDEKYLWLFDLILKDFEVDVSYMTDDEFLNCLNTKFNSLDHPICHEGEKYMSKSVNIGDQCSQIFGISYTTPIDNFIKIVKGIKYYGRYMDDSYIISSDKNFLISLLKEIKEQADKLGIFINNRKTQIYKLSTGFRFLQNRYILTNTGKVIIKINPKRITAMRRKLKNLTTKIISKELPKTVITDLFKSWFCNYYKIMSKQQKQNLLNLYANLVKTIEDSSIY